MSQPARERVRGEVLELAHLVAAVREPGVAVLALGPDLDPAAEVLARAARAGAPATARRAAARGRSSRGSRLGRILHAWTPRASPTCSTRGDGSGRTCAPTPLYPYAGLSELVGADVLVKHENHQPTGAFKVRGGVNLVSRLDDDERARGVISASTGNHGQSIAYAARLFGVRAIVVVPERANPVKVAFIRAFGAEIVEHGRDFDDAREHCEALAREHGHRYVHSGNEPDLIAGRRDRDARDPRGAPGRRRRRRADRRRQRRRGRVHRGEGRESGDRGDRRPVGRGSGRLRVLARGRARRGREHDVRRGARHRGRRSSCRSASSASRSTSSCS